MPLTTVICSLSSVLLLGPHIPQNLYYALLGVLPSCFGVTALDGVGSAEPGEMVKSFFSSVFFCHISCMFSSLGGLSIDK